MAMGTIWARPIREKCRLAAIEAEPKEQGHRKCVKYQVMSTYLYVIAILLQKQHAYIYIYT